MRRRANWIIVACALALAGASMGLTAQTRPVPGTADQPLQAAPLDTANLALRQAIAPDPAPDAPRVMPVNWVAVREDADAHQQAIQANHAVAVAELRARREAERARDNDAARRDRAREAERARQREIVEKLKADKLELDEAEATLNGAPAEIATSAPIEAARAQLELARQAEGAGPLDELHAKVEANPDDHQVRYDYAQALYAKGDGQAAVDQLLELFRRDREWNDGAAKAQLFTIFEALKPNDPVVLNGRRKLSSMIFA